MPEFNNPKARLKDKIALKIQLPLQYQLLSFWFIVITPWYEYFPFGQSNIVDLYSAGLVYKHIFEPESKTHKIGAYLGFKIKF